MERRLQCVASRGVVSSVRQIVSATSSSPIRRGAPGRGSSRRPSRRCSANRRRHWPTVLGTASTRKLMSSLSAPSAATGGRESNRLRHRGNRFEVSQTPVWVAIAKAPVECLVARGRCEPFAYVWTIEIERRRRREYRGGPLINPSVASHGEMWTMLMQMIPSADAIGQTECDASRAMGARTFVTPAAFTQAATLNRASGSGRKVGKREPGNFLRNGRCVRLSRLRFQG